MREFTAPGLGGERPAAMRAASDEFTARGAKDAGAHDELAEQVDGRRR